MNIAAIKDLDVANGPGVRVSVFVSGCNRHCRGCFNKETWDFRYGEPYTLEMEQKILDFLQNSRIRGLSILGGEPFEDRNIQRVAGLVLRVHEEMPHLDIWCFSGYTYNDLIRKKNASVNYVLDTIDVLVDGPFQIDKKNLMLKYRGSSNQRLIDMKKTRTSGVIQLWEDKYDK